MKRFQSLLPFLFFGFYWKRSCSYSPWYIKDQQLFSSTSKEPIHLKGVNWFGFETDCHVVHGLWIHPIDTYFQFLVDYQYNAIRLPFSWETVQQWNDTLSWNCCQANPWMTSLSIREAFHVFFQKAMNFGMVILMDFHTIHGKITEFPYDQDVDLNQFIETWIQVLNEFSSYPNFLGMDIKNEPHGIMTWDQWIHYVSIIIPSIYSAVPDYQGLFFLEGIEENHAVWGGSFEHFPYRRQEDCPSWWNPSKIVLSPHLYGVSIRGIQALQDTFLMYEQWFGLLSHSFCLMIGEFGGWYIGQDAEWQERAILYLQNKNISQLFYWSLNPTSADTGGLLRDDWKTPNEAKLMLHDKLQPFPTEFEFSLNM